MPFQSKRQARWAFATGKPFARRWARLTDYGALKDDAAPLHGPGGLLATPGGTRAHKWGKRTKAQQIAGNLYRGNDGKFQAGSGDSPAQPKPSAGARAPRKQTLPAVAPLKQPKGRRGGGKTPPKPKPTDAERQADQQAKREAARSAQRATRDRLLTEAGIDATTQGALTDAREGNTLTPANGAKLAGMGLAEQAADGSYRLTAAGRTVVDAAQRGDAGRVRDTMSTARDAAAKLAKAPKAGGGGGGGKAKPAQPTDDEKRAEQDKKKRAMADATAQSVGLAPGDVEALRQAAAGNPRATMATDRLGLTEQGEATDQGRRALTALERGDIRGYQAAVQDARNRMARAAASTQRAQDAQAKRTARAAETAARRAETERRRQARDAESARRRAESDARRAQADARQAAIDARRREAAFNRAPRVVKSFTVYKDAGGRHRWLVRSTTAYRDRDDEIISTAALDADSRHMTATKQFGPLRWWHVGQPDPSNPAAPWGPGLDLGDCDYSVVIGRTRVEGGTFRSAAIAERVAAIADQLELSPGFFHPLDQPDASGVYHDIRTFERSVVPVRYARASNLFTGVVTVKETRMDVDEMERRFKAAISELGLDAQQAAALGQQLIASEKTAAERGVTFKSDAPPDEITINGVVYTVKAQPAVAEKAPMPPAEMEAAGATEIDDGAADAAEDAMEADAGGPYVGDMTPEEFFAKLADLLAPVIKMQDMVKSIGDMTGELKSMYGGVATKDDARAQELIALKAQLAALTATIAQIEGAQPATILPDEVAAALKSVGPAAPADPDALVIPNDPARPFAAIGAQTFPELYRGYGENGWQKQT